jgi:hypothetical protein
MEAGQTMYKLQRITKEPGTALRIQISIPSDGDAGLAHGGTFWFQPAGDPSGDDAVGGLNEQQARAIMDDASLAPHFTCTPDLPKASVVVDDVKDGKTRDDVTQPDGGAASKKKKG